MGKKIVMKQYNGSSYDELYPKTLASLVDNLQTTVSGYGYSQIYSSSYIGSGIYGYNNPNILTFSFVPKFLAIYGYARSNTSGSSSDAIYQVTSIGVYGGCITNVNGVSIGYNPATYMGAVKLPTTWNNTISWYGWSSASEQLNESGSTYYYIAIG